MSKLAYSLIEDSNYKAKVKRTTRKQMFNKEGFVTGTAFELQFGFSDIETNVEEYEGGGVEVMHLPKIKQELIDN